VVDFLYDLYLTVSQYFPEYWAGTIASAAFGVLAGAWINSRIQTRKSVVEELNAIRAALSLCFSITNRFVNLKLQYVRSTRDRFAQDRQEYEEFKERARTHKGPPQLVYEFRGDLRTLSPITVPIQVLERCVYEKISVSGRALAALSDFTSAIDGLKESTKYRNEWIEEVRKEQLPDDLLAERYFGLINPTGMTDQRFKGNIEAIYSQTDDCIFFPLILAEDLSKRGNQLRRKNRWKYWFGLPKTMKADWSTARAQGLILKDDECALWLGGFKEEPTRWQRIRARIFVTSGI